MRRQDWPQSARRRRPALRRNQSPGGRRAIARPGGALGHGVGTGAADVVLVLGDVGQVREIAEGPDDANGPVGRQAAHDRLQLLPGGLVGVAPELDPDAADVFDEVEHRLALDSRDGE
jgi:hypothetical protein